MDNSVLVRNCWYVAAWGDELIPGALFAITVANQPLVIYRSDAGGLVALEDRCCHRSAPLSKGRIEDGCNVRCMYHGFKFGPDGRCLDIPGETRIPGAARVRRYAIVERHSWVWVWMGNAELAEESLIPAAVGFDNPAYLLKRGSIDYAADYQLINDNLTDFSHLSYVHANSFGASDHWAASRPKIERLERGIRVSRWMPAKAAFRDDAPVLTRGTSGEVPAALYQTYDFMAPGILLMYTATVGRDGVPDDLASPPLADPLSANFTSQAVTPMDGQSSRYFFSWGPRRADGGEEMAEGMLAIARKAFAEDRDVIEAQQRSLNRERARQIMTSADEGPLLMRKVLRELAATEEQSASVSSGPVSV